MLQFKFNNKKANNGLLYIVDELIRLNKYADMYTTLKIVYFADINHLKEYLRPVFGDHYIAMKNGPVPSCIYDIVKQANIGSAILRKDGNNLFPLREPDLDVLSESEVECINKAIHDHYNLSFNAICQKSHDKSYKLADTNDNITYENIITQTIGITDPGIIDYIQEYAYFESFC